MTPEQKARQEIDRLLTAAGWAEQPATLRRRLGHMPPVHNDGLWDAQEEAILSLEHSLAHDRPRALIQMATGSGKTYTAVNAAYRLIKHADAKRVLFLVDRTNLGKQALNEFANFVAPDDGRKFSELYNIRGHNIGRHDKGQAQGRPLPGGCHHLWRA